MKKKVLISTALAGFIRSFLMNDIQILQSMGYEVHCAANKNHAGVGEIEKYFEDRGIIFHQIDFSSNKPISKETLISLKQIRNLIEKYDFSIVHCHTPISGAICRLACRKKRKCGMKVIYTTHGFYFHKSSSKKNWIIFKTIEDFMSRFTDMIITINNEDYNNASKMHCKDVRYIPGVGVDINKFRDTSIDKNEYRKKLGIEKDSIVVLAIGELSERKNHQVIIKALGELRLQNIVFVICGNAITNAETTDLIKKLSIDNGVDTRLLGLRKDIAEICHCADIGVMPSSREGLGLAGIEMLASGLPIVASNVHGIVDYVVDGENGYLCNPYNPHEFAISIKKLLDSNLRNAMNLKCSDSVEGFDKNISYSHMIKIYKDIIYSKER